MRSQFEQQELITKQALSDYQEIWIEAFLVDRKAANVSPGTLRTYRAKLALWVKFCDSQLVNRVGQITPDTIRRYLLWLGETHNQGGVHGCYRVLKTFLLWYWGETDQEGNCPIAKVKAPRLRNEPLEPADLKDVEQLIKTCDSDPPGLRDKAMLLVLLDTGARASELCSLDLDDVDLQAGSLMIRQAKGGKYRSAFLSRTTRRAVRAYVKARTDNHPALWLTRRGERLTYWGLRQVVERRAVEAGIKRVTLHSFRRAFAITMLRGGVDIYSLQELMGHADLQVLRRYLKQTGDDLRTAHAKGSPVERMRGR